MKYAFIASIIALCISCTQKPHPKTHVVEIKSMKFIPAEISVNPGDTITWINRDFVNHDVTEQKNKSWQSGPLKTGASWSKAIDKSDEYFCSIHVVMTGKIKVN